MFEWNGILKNIDILLLKTSITLLFTMTTVITIVINKT